MLRFKPNIVSKGCNFVLLVGHIIEKRYRQRIETIRSALHIVIMFQFDGARFQRGEASANFGIGDNIVSASVIGRLEQWSTSRLLSFIAIIIQSESWYVDYFMNIYCCRHGHRQRPGKMSVRGSCQQYRGEICAERLQQQSIFVPHNIPQALSEKQLSG